MGYIIGTIVVICLSLLTISLCKAASDRDDWEDIYH